VPATEGSKVPNKLHGGKADKIPTSAFPAKKVAQGASVEKEHTSSKTLAKEIARDHLTEDMNYYEKLRKMEKKASSDVSYEEAGIPTPPPWKREDFIKVRRKAAKRSGGHVRFTNSPQYGFSAVHTKEKKAMQTAFIAGLTDELEKIAISAGLRRAAQGAREAIEMKVPGQVRSLAKAKVLKEHPIYHSWPLRGIPTGPRR
jgi:hypothetical protein